MRRAVCRRGLLPTTIVVLGLLLGGAPASAQQIIPVVGGPAVAVPAFDPNDYADSETCQLALNAAINQLSASLSMLPALTPPANNNDAANAIRAAMDALNAQRPACLAKASSLPPPPLAPPPLAPPPLQTPAPDASGKVDCGPVAIGGVSTRLYARGLTCQEARDILAGVPNGWQCWGVPSPAGQTRLLCRRTGVPARNFNGWTASLPRSGERCAPVKHQGRWWDVHKDRVTCGFARNTALRGLRNDHPIVYELEFPGQGIGKQWECRRYGLGAQRYGLCLKRTERRYVSWMPSARRT